MNIEKTILTNHKPIDVLLQMKKIAEEGTENEDIKKIAQDASRITNKVEQQKYIFDKVHDLAVFRASPNDRQQLRTTENIIREQKANCTGYTTLLSSSLLLLNIPHTLRLVNTEKGQAGFNHVYLMTDEAVMDLVLNQKQDGTDEFYNRSEPFFNDEVVFYNKIDLPMLTTVNGRVSSSRKIREKIRVYDGWFDTVADLMGDECKRECDVKHIQDPELRQACKAKCPSEQYYTVPDVRYQAGQQSLFSGQNLLIIGGVGALIYLITRKK